MWDNKDIYTTWPLPPALRDAHFSSPSPAVSSSGRCSLQSLESLSGREVVSRRVLVCDIALRGSGLHQRPGQQEVEEEEEEGEEKEEMEMKIEI